jgi:uncharacterized protein (DUF1810 family)
VHPILGQRLLELTSIILGHRDAGIDHLMGKHIDAVKLQSCMTLFSLVAEKGSPEESLFEEVLAHFFSSAKCPITLSKMA